MEKQVVITVRGGCVQHVATNFNCSVQIIDYDNDDEAIGDVLEPDTIELDENILVDD